MVKEAHLDRVASGLAPVTPGWFVVNTAEAAWVTNDDWSGGVCILESDELVLRDRPDLTAYQKPNAGFTLRVVPPRRPAGLYHAESVQEDFLILQGECLLIIEDEERHLSTWDFVHCPPMTAHTFSRHRKQPMCDPRHRQPARRSGTDLPSLRDRPPTWRRVGGHHARSGTAWRVGGSASQRMGRPSMGWQGLSRNVAGAAAPRPVAVAPAPKPLAWARVRECHSAISGRQRNNATSPSAGVAL
jgi:mannose-6-phosphate isomerase-like protein (cupin superfamily)